MHERYSQGQAACVAWLRAVLVSPAVKHEDADDTGDLTPSSSWKNMQP